MPSVLPGAPIVPPVVAIKGSEKLLAKTFVTSVLNVARNVTFAAFVNWPAGTDRLIELSVGAV